MKNEDVGELTYLFLFVFSVPWVFCVLVLAAGTANATEPNLTDFKWEVTRMLRI